MTKSVAIVGAGIVGATAAYQLSKKGIAVTVFDAGVGQATKAAAGIICPWLSQRRNKDWYQLVSHGAAYYPVLMEQLRADGVADLPYEQVGAYIFKHTEKQLKKVEEMAVERRVDAPMIGEVEALSGEDVAKVIPGWANPDGALYCSGGGRVDGEKLVALLLEQAVKNGATVKRQKVSLSKEGEDIRVVAGEEVLSFDAVILSSGAWVKELLEGLDYYVDVRPQKGQLIELELETSEDTSKWPVCMLHGEIDILPFPGGKILVGATHENTQGFDLTPDEALLDGMYAEACASLPALKDAKRSGIRVGTRAYTSDFLPFFGKVPETSNAFVASGLGSSGLTSGVWIGELLARLSAKETVDFAVENYPPKNYIRKT